MVDSKKLQQVKKEILLIDIDWHDHWPRWNDDDDSKSLEGLKAACVQRNNALPRAKVQLSWDETDQPGWPAFDFNIHKLEIKRAHVIKCHKSRNQISGWWKDIETGLAESDKHTTSSWVLWALNHSSPHAALLHMETTHTSSGLDEFHVCLIIIRNFARPRICTFVSEGKVTIWYFQTINWTICCMVKGLKGYFAFQVVTLGGFIMIK